MSMNDELCDSVIRDAWDRHQALPNPYLVNHPPDQNGAIESVAGVMHHLLNFLERHQEIRAMADYTRLMNDISELSGKVDALIEKANTPPPPPPDDQPSVDQAAAAVEAIIAKIPA